MHKKDDLCRREKKKEGAAMYREHTKTIKIGNQVIGGGHPVLIPVSYTHLTLPTN